MKESDLDRLRTLEIKEAARDVLNQYCLALDTDDRKLLEQVFTEDVALKRPPDQDLLGRAAVMEFFAGALDDRVDLRKHYQTNAVVKVTGNDGAELDAYFIGLHHNRGALSLAFGNYWMKVVMDGDNARISEMRIDVETPIQPVRGMLGQ